MRIVVLFFLIINCAFSQDLLKTKGNVSYSGKVVAIDSSNIGFIETGMESIAVPPYKVFETVVLENGEIIIADNLLQIGPNHPLWHPGTAQLSGKYIGPPKEDKNNVSSQQRSVRTFNIPYLEYTKQKIKRFLLHSKSEYQIAYAYGPVSLAVYDWFNDDDLHTQEYSGVILGLEKKNEKITLGLRVSYLDEIWKIESLTRTDENKQENQYKLQGNINYNSKWWGIGTGLFVYYREYKYIYHYTETNGSPLDEIDRENYFSLLPSFYLRLGKDSFYFELGGADSYMTRPEGQYIHFNLGFRPSKTLQQFRFGLTDTLSELNLYQTAFFIDSIIRINQHVAIEPCVTLNPFDIGYMQKGIESITINLRIQR